MKSRLLLGLVLFGCLSEFPAAPPGELDGADVETSRDSAVDRAILDPDATPPDARPIDQGTPPVDQAVDAAPPEPDQAVDARPPEVDANCLPELCNGLDDDCDRRVDEVTGVGEPCAAGEGPCRQEGEQVCDLTLGVVVCNAQPIEPTDEICNFADDDCDGLADEELGVGMSCPLGEGLCVGLGTYACSADGEVVCEGEVIEPDPEVCDGEDQDCDERIDEDFGIGSPCFGGLGACRREGVLVCTRNGESATCNAMVGAADVEHCNDLDDDCDGRTDEEFPSLGSECFDGLGTCRTAGRLVCAANGERVQCDAATGMPGVERCDGLDDDCDGRTDEAFPGLGDACTAGRGACLRMGVLQCAPNGQGTACDAVAAPPGVESCNTRDDDCDGLTDETFPTLGQECTAGEGDCQRRGHLACAPGGQGVACDAPAGGPQAERCNGADDDCDGRTDETFPTLGQDCEEGQGQCQTRGVLGCTQDGQGTECNALSPAPQAERCNLLDDDCDGATDEDLGLEDRCTVGVGACARPGVPACGPQGDVICTGMPGDVQREVCDGADQDCDGLTDEGFRVGDPCQVGVGGCTRAGTVECQGVDSGCSAMPGLPVDEVCNDEDDDCDTRIDEGNSCVSTAVQRCRLWIGQADNDGVPAQVAAAWDGCPAADQDWEGQVRCTSSGRTGLFYALPITGVVDANDVLGVALTCDEDPVPAWIQQHCVVYLAHSDGGGTGAITGLNPSTCTLLANRGDAPNPRCVHTNGDGLFHPMWLRGNVNSSDVFGITLRCADPARADRAAGLQNGLAATFAWHFRSQAGLLCDESVPIMNGSPDWDADPGVVSCPLDGTDESGTRRCATGTRAGSFRAFLLGANAAFCSTFGVALRAR